MTTRSLSLAVVLTLFMTLPGMVWANDKRYDVPIADSPVLGPPEAPVTIIEFLDFQ